MTNHLTEEVARTRLCCGPRWNSTLNNQNCAGSQCMAWRWHIPHPPIGDATKGKAKDTVETPQDRDYDILGYCGLAGQ